MQKPKILDFQSYIDEINRLDLVIEQAQVARAKVMAELEAAQKFKTRMDKFLDFVGYIPAQSD